MEDNKFKITLKIDGKNKTFITEPTGRIVYRAAEVAQDLATKPFDNDMFDELLDFVVKLFQDQFTTDELLDGVGVGTLGKVMLGYVQLGDEDSVISRFINKGKVLPNQKAGSTTSR